jgi:GNAT superfamily N-acetyltransferase
MNYRLAMENDLIALAEMRWDFRMEDNGIIPVVSRQDFMDACASFLSRGLADGRWAYWVAELEGEIVSHIYIQRIYKVPKPNRLQDAYGYVTNVYTRPAYRGQGIGSELLRHVLDWAKEQDLECLIVWPSERSVAFYERAGYTAAHEILEREIRPYVG